jgi:hypothetical protein
MDASLRVEPETAHALSMNLAETCGTQVTPENTAAFLNFTENKSRAAISR